MVVRGTRHNAEHHCDREEGEARRATPEAACISEQMFYRPKVKYGEMESGQAKTFKAA